MKKIGLFIVLISLLIPVFSQKSLNVMTYNIRLDLPSDSLNSWPYRKDNLISEVLFYETDILGVQEALPHQMQDLQNGLPGFKYAGVGRDTSKWGEYSAIFYNAERLKIIEQNTFWLSENMNAVGVKGWDAAYPRIVTWAKFKDQKIKKVFYYFNTHFDHIGKEARRQSAHLLLQQVAKIAGKFPTIISGDFNANINDEPIKIILDKNDPLHFTDSKVISATPHYGPSGSFNAFKQKEQSDLPIDFIFIKNGVTVLKHSNFSQTWNGRFASDHFSVFAKILIGDKE
ncbi:MAG: endonuclease/exonuclease/phosphatase family protein [Ginsengibacter sp.]